MSFYPRKRVSKTGSTRSYKKGFAQGLAAAKRGLRPYRKRY